jgi:hypothetical protein
MEQKLVRVPFDVEMAKKITNREVKGNICVIDFPLKIDSFYATDIKSERGKLNVIITKANDSFQCFICDEKGYLYINGDKWNKNPLYLEVPEDMVYKHLETEGHVFKPFDKVLVRQSTSSPWECAFFSNYTDQIPKYRCQGMNYMYCIPYEGNEHLVNTKIGDDDE